MSIRTRIAASRWMQDEHGKAQAMSPHTSLASSSSGGS